MYTEHERDTSFTPGRLPGRLIHTSISISRPSRHRFVGIYRDNNNNYYACDGATAGLELQLLRIHLLELPGHLQIQFCRAECPTLKLSSLMAVKAKTEANVLSCRGAKVPSGDICATMIGTVRTA